LDFSQPLLMGVLNLTPDSFSDGGSLQSADALVTRAEALVSAGATILDLGGESTRPGALGVDADTEIRRVLPALSALARLQLPAALSIDTSKAAVAQAALTAGATLVNDVSALRDPQMAQVVADAGAALILMHMRGEPRTMQQGEIVYENIVNEVCQALTHARDRAVAAGVDSARIMLDPGLGFGKTTAHNLSLTRHLDAVAALGHAVVYGPSRKRFLGELTRRDVTDRDRATAAICALAVTHGAHILRVHDVAAVRDAVLVAYALQHAS